MLPTLADVAAARRGKPMPKDPIGRAKAHTTFDREDAWPTPQLDGHAAMRAQYALGLAGRTGGEE